MIEGSEFNVQFRTHLLCYNLNYFGEGLVRFKDGHCELEGTRLRENPGLLRGCWGFCLGAAFDCACCGVGNYVLAAIAVFTVKPLVWMLGSVEEANPLVLAANREVRVKGRVVTFYAFTPSIYRRLRFCVLADTERQAQQIAERLQAIKPEEPPEEER